jgi:hypothetical protein
MTPNDKSFAQDPAEGSRDVIDRELAKRDRKPKSDDKDDAKPTPKGKDDE